jgi:hypothetical protein
VIYDAYRDKKVVGVFVRLRAPLHPSFPLTPDRGIISTPIYDRLLYRQRTELSSFT